MQTSKERDRYIHRPALNTQSSQKLPHPEHAVKMLHIPDFIMVCSCVQAGHGEPPPARFQACPDD